MSEKGDTHDATSIQRSLLEVLAFMTEFGSDEIELTITTNDGRRSIVRIEVSDGDN